MGSAPLIAGGHATIYVSDVDASLRFYIGVLGLALRDRAADGSATVDCGGGFVLRLHPTTPAAARPGTSGAITIGLTATQPLELAVEKLRAHGVFFRGDIVETPHGRVAFFGDPDGNDLYLSEPDES